MRNMPAIFLGVFLTLAASWFGLVYMGNAQLGSLEPTTAQLDPATQGPMVGEELHPVPLSGIARQGKQVYIENGCMYCHSQQVRRKGYGADYERGWGDRQSVPRDYIWQERVMLGTSRTGPDLMTIGQRNPDPSWHHLHLYDPQITSPGSIMPPFPFLYKVQPIRDGVPHPLALKLPPEFVKKHKIPAGYEVIPGPKAIALVAYLQELKMDYDLPEIKRK